MQEELKQNRMFIDHLLNEHKKIGNSRELALAFTNLQRGAMWLGKALGEAGAANPYPDSTNTSNERIEERTDQAKDNPATAEGIPLTSKIIGIKWMRLQIEGVVDSLKNKFQYPAITVAIQALEEAKMWYGQELNSIRLNDNLKF